MNHLIHPLVGRRASLPMSIVAVLAVLSFAVLVNGGLAHAQAQTLNSQRWLSDSGNYLGISSGANYNGHIHNISAMNKCLEVPAGNFYGTSGWLNPSGAQLQLFDCAPKDAQHGYGLNQLWQQSYNADGSWTFFVTNPMGKFCLDSQAGQTAQSSLVKVNPCNNNATQHWSVDVLGQLVSVATAGYCVDDSNANPDNGAKIVLSPCITHIG